MEDSAMGKAIFVFALAFIVLLVFGAIGGGCAVYPKYRVYSQEHSGKAELAKAVWAKKVLVEEAQAQLDSADLIKQADIIRAEGVAEANEIISGSITAEYTQWKWVEGLHDGSSEVIYVPTEANLPILEARDVRRP